MDSSLIAPGKTRGDGSTSTISRLSKRMGTLIPFSLVPAVAYLVVFYAYPLVRMLRSSLYDPDFTLDHYQHFIGTPAYPSVLANTFEIAFFVTFLCLLLGYPLAYFLSNQPTRVANLFMVFVLLPFFTSILVRNYAWMVLLSANGVFNQILVSLGLISTPLRLMFNRFGVVIAMIHVMLPWMILPMYSVMVRIDRDLLKAADNLGAGPFQSFRRIFLPLSMPGVTAGLILVLIFCLGFFVTPSVLGGPKETMIGQLILMNTKLLKWGFASTSGVVLLVLTLAILILGSRLVGFGQIVGAGATAGDTVAGPEAPRTSGRASLKVLRRRLTSHQLFQQWASLIGKIGDRVASIFAAPARLVVRSRKVLLWITCISIFVFLILPLFIVVPISFSSAMFLTFPPPGFSLQWYETYLSDRAWISATFRSFQVATLTMLIATVLATPASMALVRRDFRLKTVLYTFILTPLIVPEIITGLAVYFLVAQIGLVDTSAGLVLGHTVFALPPAIVVISAALQTFDWDLERAALSLGANRIRTLFRVTLPLILPGVLSAGLFAFLRSFDELVMALLIGGIRATTLPRKMWEGIKEQINPTIASVSTLLIVFTIVALVSLELLRRRTSKT